MSSNAPTPEPSHDSATVQRVISLIDLTDLDDAHRPDGIERLIADALQHGTAAVCVWPEFVTRSASDLASSDVRVATVANFPEGTASTEAVAAEVAASLEAGADEIDVVLPWRSLLAGDLEHARTVIEASAHAVHQTPGALLKVILETGELPDVATISRAAAIAIEAGADFLKTSTGKTATGATPTAVAALLDAVAARDGHVGVKPSGGVRTVADATALLDLADARLGPEWATPATFRFGASGLLTDALEALGRR